MTNTTSNTNTAADSATLDAIADLMSGKEWDAETLTAISELVTLTGRNIGDC